MNLSEIRKKAQQEKAGSITGAALSPEEPETVTAEPVPERAAPEPVQEPAEGLAGVFAEFDREEPSVGPLREAEEERLVFDPLAVLLAGREAAEGSDETEMAEALPVYDRAEFLELLCFRVAAEKYAVNIMEIKEIIKPREVTEVPRVPPFVAGVLSLRGIIIPVFDMRKRLGHNGAHGAGKERIIVVRKGEEFCGIQVDEVTQVVRIAADTIEQPPAVLEGIDRDFVTGIGRFDGQMLILLNLEKVLDLNLS